MPTRSPAKYEEWPCREKSEEKPFNQHSLKGREPEESVQPAQPERERVFKLERERE